MKQKKQHIMKQKKQHIVWLSGLFLAACGTEGATDGPPIPADTSMASLSDSEAQELCEWAFDLFPQPDFEIASCWIAALSSDTCEETYFMCMQQDVLDAGCEEATASDLPACAADVTVGEMEACWRELAVQVANRADGLSCESTLADAERVFEPPPACEAVAEICPGLAGDV